MRALVRSGLRRRRKPTGRQPVDILSARPLRTPCLGRNLSEGRDSPCMAHLLFLAHAGADTEQALRLAAAIEASPEARDAGLKVWVDKRPDGDRLHAGTPWQNQLERASAKESTAFGLLLTREGARNWVRLEAPAGRSTPSSPTIRADLEHLPIVARRYRRASRRATGPIGTSSRRWNRHNTGGQPKTSNRRPPVGLKA